MSHVVTILGTDCGVVSAVGAEETRGTNAELKSLTGIPRPRDKACIVVPLLGLTVALGINIGVADIGSVFLAH